METRMDFHLLSRSYTVKRLDKVDVDAAFELMSKNTVFYQYHPPFVTKESIIKDMEALPPQKSDEDKYYVGFFENQTLIAVMDLILAYPDEETAFIGFFMTDVRYQRKGIGSKMIREVCACLKASGCKKVRLGVDKGNPQSYAFWVKNQFRVIEEGAYLLMEFVL